MQLHTCTAGYRNASDVCGFLVVGGGLHVNWVVLCLAWPLPQQLNFPRQQLQNCSAPPHTHTHTLITKWRYRYYKWLFCTLAKVTVCLQGTQAAHSPSDLLFLTNICCWFFLPPLHLSLLHLVAFAAQNTDYHSIFIIISWGDEAELFL